MLSPVQVPQNCSPAFFHSCASAMSSKISYTIQSFQTGGMATLTICFLISGNREVVAANRVAAIKTKPIDDADPMRKFSIGPGDTHTKFQYRPNIVDANTIAPFLRLL